MRGNRVVVVGAGFSGLAAALALAGAGCAVRLVEARDRVGGRTLSRPLPGGGWLDLGAQWIGPTQDRMYALVAAHGLATFPSPAQGAPTLRCAGRRRAEAPGSVAAVLDTLDGLAARLDPAAPCRAAEAAEWDRTTLGGWLAATAPDPVTARYAGRLLAGGLLAASPDEVSLLQMLFYLRSGGGTGILLGMAGGAQQDRIVGGPAGGPGALGRHRDRHPVERLPGGRSRGRRARRRRGAGRPPLNLVKTKKIFHTSIEKFLHLVT